MHTHTSTHTTHTLFPSGGLQHQDLRFSFSTLHNVYTIRVLSLNLFTTLRKSQIKDEWTVPSQLWADLQVLSVCQPHSGIRRELNSSMYVINR